MKKNDAIEMIEILKNTYPNAKCSLDFSSTFELLIAVMLSAQCTDERVNKTTPSIFSKFNKPIDFANIELSLLEELIHPCGFYKTKAKNIKATSKILVEKYNSEVPHTIEELMNLPGVGRKTANVVMLEGFHLPQGIAIDTHAKRISNRIGLSKNTDPSKIEQDLLKLFPSKYYEDINHLFIWHGRNICSSRKANCPNCPIKNFCKYYSKIV